MDLILNTYGTTLAKELDNFVVVHNDGKQRIHPDSLKSISISKGAQITSDAALLAIEHEIDVLFVDGKGSPRGRIWSNKYGSVSTIRKNQVNFTFSTDALLWIKNILQEKIENQQAMLLSIPNDDPATEQKRENAIKKLEDYRNKINHTQGEIVAELAPTLRGWEGAASRVYFSTLALFLPQNFAFAKRSQHPATDIFNCLLNYGYGVLYGKVESALIKAGIDPYVGVFHRDDYNRPVLVFDVIEKYRVWVDFVVVALARQNVIDEEAYSVKEDGSYWLEGLGKRILIQSLNDYFDEVIPMAGKQRSRITHIQDFAHQFAQFLLNYKA